MMVPAKNNISAPSQIGAELFLVRKSTSGVELIRLQGYLYSHLLPIAQDGQRNHLPHLRRVEDV